MRLVPATVIVWMLTVLGLWAEPKRDTAPILRVVGRFNVAHACPVSPDLAFTNAHVTDLRPFDSDVQAYPLAYENGDGNIGFVFPVALDRGRDLAVMRIEPPVGRFYERAEQAPVVGAKVWFVGYDWSNKGKAFSTEVIETTVNRVLAGHLVLKDAGEPGSSGSCVLDESGRLVAINAWGFEVGRSSQVGIAVGVWGKLGRTDSAETPN